MCCPRRNIQRLRDDASSVSSNLNNKCTGKTAGFLLYILMLSLLNTILLMLAANDKFSRAIERSPDTVSIAFKDVETFIKNTQLQTSFVATSSFEITMDQISNDLENIEKLLGHPFKKDFMRETGFDRTIEELTELKSADLETNLERYSSTASRNKFRDIRSKISFPITHKDLGTFHDQLYSATKQISNTKSAVNFEKIMIKTQEIINNELKVVENHRDSILYKLTALEILLQPNAKLYIFRLERHLHDLQKHVSQQIRNKIGRCKPIWDIFYYLREHICKSAVEPLNALSFSYFTSILIFLCLTPIIINLIGYYKEISVHFPESTINGNFGHELSVRDQAVWTSPQSRSTSSGNHNFLPLPPPLNDETRWASPTQKFKILFDKSESPFKIVLDDLTRTLQRHQISAQNRFQSAELVRTGQDCSPGSLASFPSEVPIPPRPPSIASIRSAPRLAGLYTIAKAKSIRVDWAEFGTLVDQLVEDVPSEITDSQNFEGLASGLSHSITEAMSKATTTSVPISDGWIPSDLVDLVREKRKARKRAQRTPCPLDIARANLLSNTLRDKLRDFHSERWWAKVSSVSVSDGSIWKLARSLKRSKTPSTYGPIHGPNGLVYDSEGKAEIFSDHLETVFADVGVFCAALAAANAGFLGAPAAIQYSSAPAVSTSYFSQPLATVHAAPAVAAVHAAPAVAAVHAAPVAVHAPAIGASQQSVIRSLGGNQAISTYSKAVDSAFSTVRKYDTRITNDALSVAHAPVAYAAPVATYAHAAPVATYAHAAPVATYAHAAPVATYAHAAPVATYAHAAPVATYAHAAPVATYAAAAPVISKAAVSYSPAAVVAHTSFAGLGAHYEW
ncbi:larval/pupal cuticle protein h1c-like protein-related [Holotrichia oblita]|uniref:Larval/pupal cuticle protein h1c-like protein-related n=1 Tax=Holotrichia oblita TaxID=644536 RepID=A0ACB9SW59_HOLOL|nr:larval/pupal cuticle protein h1c-like protein-related [Holotrichia oblita]